MTYDEGTNSLVVTLDLEPDEYTGGLVVNSHSPAFIVIFGNEVLFSPENSVGVGDLWSVDAGTFTWVDGTTLAAPYNGTVTSA